MKTQIKSIIVIATITLLTACGTTRGSKQVTAPAGVATSPQQPQVRRAGIKQVSAKPAEFVEVTKDSTGNIVTNRLTTHLITALPKQRVYEEAEGAQEFETHKALGSVMQLEFERVWTALEHRKNLDVLASKYGATTNEIAVLKKLLAPTISGETNGVAAVKGAAPQLGLGAIYHAPADDAELRQQFEELRFQQWKAEQYRKKGFK